MKENKSRKGKIVRLNILKLYDSENCIRSRYFDHERVIVNCKIFQDSSKGKVTNFYFLSLLFWILSTNDIRKSDYTVCL